MKRRLFGRILPLLLVAAIFAVLLWSSDRITLQGERTIYTVECTQGQWDGETCTGKLVPGPRFTFRASVRRQEVLYWVRGSSAPSGKFSDCSVKDRDNWSCNVQLDQSPALTYELRGGTPTRGTAGLAMTFHDVPKWKWFAIDAGLGFLFDRANP
jgi:hypothetical protein